MDDLISRQTAIDAMELLIKDLRKDTVDVMNFGHNYNHGVADAIATLKHLPSAERRGRWMPHREKSREYIGTVLVDVEYDYWFCDTCGYQVENGQPMYNFCPNCGARMEVE